MRTHYHQVREMTVVHPKEGAVYWEGPVDVALVASLTGEKGFGMEILR